MQSVYPVRSFIRFQAKQQLLADRFGSRSSTVTTWQAEVMRVSSDRCSKEECSTHPSLELEDWEAIAPFDEALFQVVTTAILHPCRNLDVYQACTSIEQSNAIEDRVSEEIVTTYCRMEQAPSTTLVDQLNQLL